MVKPSSAPILAAEIVQETKDEWAAIANKVLDMIKPHMETIVPLVVAKLQAKYQPIKEGKPITEAQDNVIIRLPDYGEEQPPP